MVIFFTIIFHEEKDDERDNTSDQTSLPQWHPVGMDTCKSEDTLIDGYQFSYSVHGNLGNDQNSTREVLRGHDLYRGIRISESGLYTIYSRSL